MVWFSGGVVWVQWGCGMGVVGVWYECSGGVVWCSGDVVWVQWGCGIGVVGAWHECSGGVA